MAHLAKRSPVLEDNHGPAEPCVLRAARRPAQVAEGPETASRFEGTDRGEIGPGTGPGQHGKAGQKEGRRGPKRGGNAMQGSASRQLHAYAPAIVTLII